MPNFDYIKFNCHDIADNIIIGYSKTSGHDDEKWEIVIGGWSGTLSVIRDRNQGESLASVTHAYLPNFYFLEFKKNIFVKIEDGKISVYNDQFPTFMSLQELSWRYKLKNNKHVKFKPDF